MIAEYKVNLSGETKGCLDKNGFRHAKKEGVKVFRAIKKSLIAQYGEDRIQQFVENEFTVLTVV